MFPFKPLQVFLQDQGNESNSELSLLESLSEFYTEIYSQRPFNSNDGGMGLESSFFLWSIMEKIKPQVIVESGIWKGFTTYLFDRLSATESIYCFDPIVRSPSFIQYTSKKSTYFDSDWATPHFSFISSTNAVAFFDDHQDQLERLAIAYARGFRYVVFDDNYFFGGGGHAGLATYMRESEDLLRCMIKDIYISPPLLLKNKGIAPLFEASLEMPNVLATCLHEENYNWLTLVELKNNLLHSCSQKPSDDYIISTYARAL